MSDIMVTAHLPAPAALTPWEMFLHADLIVRAVMIGLAIASLSAWTILLAKRWQLGRLALSLQQAQGQLLQAAQLDAAAAHPALQTGIVHALIAEAQSELQLSRDLSDKAGIRERIGMRLTRTELKLARELKQGIGVLASIGSTAPFVGLFGTVWGIMNSFIGIAQSNTTNLAVVAPGIAEALFATALGLVAAIPAVLIYNYFSRSLATLRGLIGDISSGVQVLVSRDLDRQAGRG